MDLEHHFSSCLVKAPHQLVCTGLQQTRGPSGTCKMLCNGLCQNTSTKCGDFLMQWNYSAVPTLGPLLPAVALAGSGSKGLSPPHLQPSIGALPSGTGTHTVLLWH